MTLKEKQTMSIIEINNQSAYEEVKAIFEKLEQNFERINELEDQLPNAHIHKKMTGWLEEQEEYLIEEIVEYLMEGEKENDKKDFTFDLEYFLTKIENSLKFNSPDSLKNNKIPCRFPKHKYEEAFGLLDKKIPLEGDFRPYSRHFLSQLLKQASSYICLAI